MTKSIPLAATWIDRFVRKFVIKAVFIDFSIDKSIYDTCRSTSISYRALFQCLWVTRVSLNDNLKVWT